ncbi:unnamed protein product [Spodoptera exigua]|nr:unnamed protein product [Spodoptera exigua]
MFRTGSLRILLCFFFKIPDLSFFLLEQEHLDSLGTKVRGTSIKFLFSKGLVKGFLLLIILFNFNGSISSRPITIPNIASSLSIISATLAIESCYEVMLPLLTNK